MEAKISTWKQQRTSLGAKHSRVNRELAFHFAGWATDYARRASATTIAIAIEDLSTLEAGGYHRARCRPCGLDGNRDQVAAVNIAKRAITGLDSLTADRKTWRKRVKKAVHAPVKRVRRPKIAPNPQTDPPQAGAELRGTGGGENSHNLSSCNSSVGVGHGEAPGHS